MLTVNKGPIIIISVHSSSRAGAPHPCLDFSMPVRCIVMLAGSAKIIDYANRFLFHSRLKARYTLATRPSTTAERALVLGIEPLNSELAYVVVGRTSRAPGNLGIPSGEFRYVPLLCSCFHLHGSTRGDWALPDMDMENIQLRRLLITSCHCHIHYHRHSTKTSVQIKRSR